MRAFPKPSIDWFAVFIPVSFVLAYVPSFKNEVALFICSCLAMVAVSAWIGRATEQLAAKIGATWGGMLNAAFGNLPELIFGLIALSKGLGPLVKAAWTGAIIGNLLLVLGNAMAAGGAKHGTQKFRVDRANDASTGLLIASVALLLPTVYAYAFRTRAEIMSGAAMQDISFWLALFLLLAYFSSLIHTFLSARAQAAEARSAGQSAEPDQATEGRPWSVQTTVTVLLVSSVLISFLSEYVTDSAEVVKTSFGLTDLFLGVIVIAAIGNVATQISAVSMAMKNKMDLSFEISMSASTQMALLVVPFLVLMSHPLGHPVSLHFTLPEIVAVGAAVVITTQISQDGTCNWLNGVQLMVLYAIIAVLFFFLPGS